MTDFQQKKQEILEEAQSFIDDDELIAEASAEASKALDALYLEELLKHKIIVRDGQINHTLHAYNIEAVPVEAIKDLLS